MTGELLIDYDALAQDAMRGIVRTVLRRVAAAGRLPGEHHFYIAFDTRAPGVVVSKRLKQRYPEEMTIVLQHQFRNLTVDDEKFEVTLSFDNLPERLTVPLQAVRVFFDPSVPYGLQFDSSDLVGKGAQRVDKDHDAGAAAAEGDRRLGGARQPARDAMAGPLEPEMPAKVPRKPRSTPAETPADAGAAPASPGAAEPLPGPVQGTMSRAQGGGRPKLVRSTPDLPANDAKVVQLDKFRKK